MCHTCIIRALYCHLHHLRTLTLTLTHCTSVPHQVLYFWKLFNADHADTYYDEIMQLGLLTTQSQLHELVAGVREADGGASGVPSAGGGGGGGGGGGSGTRVSDLELAHSPLGFVKLALRGKFRVEMTVMGQKILMKHLYENELLLLTSVVAERVSFFVHHGEPRYMPACLPACLTT